MVPRRSMSPSRATEDDFQKFQAADAAAFKEKQVSESVIPLIDGTIRNAQCRSGGVVFRNLDPLTDGTIKPGNPDIYEGARPEQLARSVRNELGGMIVPTTQEELPICPNFFVAAKGPDGSLAVAMRQACYDGTLGARGIHSLQTHGQIWMGPDNSAHTITSIYHGGQLKMYTISRSGLPDTEDHPEYYMHQLNAWSLTGNIEAYRQGITAFRNARDWAEEQRNKAIASANSVIHARLGESEVADDDFLLMRPSVEHETSQSYLIDQSPSPESTRYTTPPTEPTLGTTEASESPITHHETSKRHREQAQSSSPLQSHQKKRNRAYDRYQEASSGSSAVPTRTSTSISFQMTNYSLEQDENELEVRADALESDEKGD